MVRRLLSRPSSRAAPPREPTAPDERYQLLFERHPQPMWVFDEATLRFLAVNDAAVRHYGYSRDEFLRMTVVELRPEEDRAEFRERLLGGRLAAGVTRRWRHLTRDGRVITAEVTSDPTTFAGRAARMVVAMDVTERCAAEAERDRSMALVRATLEATEDGILVVDLDGNMAGWNQKLLQLWNAPAALAAVQSTRRLMAHALAQLVAPGTLEARLRSLDSAPHQCSFDLVELRDGSIYELHSKPQQLEGEVVGRVWSVRDVTAREQALHEWRAVTARFETAFGNAPIGMLITAPDGTWLQVNRAMADLIGYPAQHLVGRGTAAFTHPDDIEKTMRHMRSALAGDGVDPRLEKRFRHRDGHAVWAVVHTTLHRHADGTPAYFIAQVQDITTQRLFEESLRRQALVFESISDAVIFSDAGGVIVDVNPAAVSMFGYAREEIVGQTAAPWHAGGAGSCELARVAAALRERGEWDGELPFRRRDGRTGVAETSVRALRDAAGALVANVTVMHDVTARRELQRQLVQAQKLEAVGSLAAGIAHEINTPTQYVGDNVRLLEEGVRGICRFVRDVRALADTARGIAPDAPLLVAFYELTRAAGIERLEEELPVAACHAREGIERIAEIVRAMRGYSHPGTAGKVLVDLNEAIRSTTIVCRNEWKYVARLTTDLDPALPLVRCHPGELQQAVLNLIVNSADAIAESHRGRQSMGTIHLSTRWDGDCVELSVSDDGCGIPEAVARNIFDPFFTTKPVGKGTGQGLALAHSTVVTRHGGSMTFTTREGAGTTFVIRLPLEPAEVTGGAAR